MIENFREIRDEYATNDISGPKEMFKKYFKFLLLGKGVFGVW